MSPEFRESLEQFLRTVPLRHLSDEELWSRFRDAEHSAPDYEFAFAVLLERCGGRVYGFCLRRLKDDQTSADEAFQEAFCDLVATRTRYKSYSDATNTLFRVASNKTTDALRLRQRRPSNALPLDLVARAESGSEGNELVAAILAAIAELPPAERSASN